MTQSASQAAAFYKGAALNKKLWTIRDQAGFPAPKTVEGSRVVPFWSSLSRVDKIIKNVPAYKGFESIELSWDEFNENWVPDIIKEGLLVGVNWSGALATGYDVSLRDLQKNIEYYLR